MEFGRPDERVKTRGEWHLKLVSCRWRIERRAKIICGSDDDVGSLDGALRRHLRHKFLRLELVSSQPDAAFVFESGIVIRTFQTRDEYSWILFAPPHHRLAIGPNLRATLQDLTQS